MRFKGIGIVLCLLLQVAQFAAGTPVMIVSGVVKNQASVLLDGIKVKVKNQSRDLMVEALTNGDGIYRAVFFNPSDVGVVAEAGNQLIVEALAQDGGQLVLREYALTADDVSRNLARVDLPVSTQGQATSGTQTPVMVVAGVIKNPAGAVLTGVEIKVRNQTRGTSVDTSTNANGVYHAIFFNPFDESAVVEVGDRLAIQAFDQGGALILSQEHVIAVDEVSRNLVNLNLSLPVEGSFSTVEQTPIMIVTGVVKDQMGDLISGSLIKVGNQSRGLMVEALTNEAGIYRAVFFDPANAGVVAEVGDQLLVEILGQAGTQLVGREHRLTADDVSGNLAVVDLVQSTTWSASLILSSGNSSVASPSLEFGMSVDASDGFDSQRDVVAPPSPQPPVRLNAYFSIDEAIVSLSNLLSDYRPVSHSTTYTFRVRADQDNFTVKWDVSAVPSSISNVRLKQVSPASSKSYDMRALTEASFEPISGSYYIFEIVLSRTYSIELSAGWNMISIPGEPSDGDPTSLLSSAPGLLLPLYRWNPARFSYEPTSELKFGEGYWALTINPTGEVLEVPLNPTSSYSRSLKAGWNMIGGVSESADFTDPQDDPDNSILPGTLYTWNPENYSYVPVTNIEPGKGYWALTMVDCQLTVTGSGSLAAPQPLVKLPELMLPIVLQTDHSSKDLVIGMDEGASLSLDGFDQLMPPVSPMKTEIEAYFDRDKVDWNLQSDIQPLQDRAEWRLVVRSEETTDLSIDTSTLPEVYQLIVVTETNQYEMENKSKVRLTGEEVILRLQPKRIIPAETVLMANYPNPFNPETWIPYHLSQDSEVVIRIYDASGRIVRTLDVGFQSFGHYANRDKAAYWDGRNRSGELVSSGLYFYRLQAIDYSQTRKMVILK